jgi:hypothetical protein
MGDLEKGIEMGGVREGWGRDSMKKESVTRETVSERVRECIHRKRELDGKV